MPVAARIAVTILIVVLIALLLVGTAFGQTIAALSPSHREPSMAATVIFVFYIIFTTVCSLGAIWIRSRPLLVLATVFLSPLLLICCILAFTTAFLTAGILLPLTWITFFCIAWPLYKPLPQAPPTSRKVMSPEEY